MLATMPCTLPPSLVLVLKIGRPQPFQAEPPLTLRLWHSNQGAGTLGSQSVQGAFARIPTRFSHRPMLQEWLETSEGFFAPGDCYLLIIPILWSSMGCLRKLWHVHEWLGLMLFPPLSTKVGRVRVGRTRSEARVCVTG